MPWICWELLFSMLCMCCANKGSSLKLYLRLSGNYVVIMIMLMSLYVYMYVCMSLSDRFVRDHDCFMLIFISIYVCMYVVV